MSLKAKSALFPEVEAVFQGEADAALEFESRFDLQKWLSRVRAVPLARGRLGNRNFVLAGGKIFEVRIVVPPPKQPPGSVQVGGDKEPLIRKTLKP